MPFAGFSTRAIFLLALSSLSYGLPGQSSSNKHANRDTPKVHLPTYDYVVVGSGPGGGPLAARLAIAGYKVLLMDAGDDEGKALQQEIPILQLAATEFPAQKWNYFVQHHDNQTLQQMDSKFTWKLPNGELFVGTNPPAGATPLGIWYPRAGTLGGCSGHNALITIKPQNSDWNDIVSLTGDQSWASGLMENYWQRLENCQYLPKGTIGHGFDGWFETSLTDVNLYLDDNKASLFIRSAAEVIGNRPNSTAKLNQYLTGDINNYSPTRDFTEGIFQIPTAVKQPKWSRSGPRDFILEIANAVNSDGSRKYHLDLRLRSLVTKIRFDHSKGVPKAVGVDFLDGQSLYRADPRSKSSFPKAVGSVNASREVIISAGTFNTPQLLKLSGIGPAEELKKHNIPVVVNLPGVGANLMDRYETSVIGESTEDFNLFNECTLLETPDDPCLLEWQNNHTSPGIYSSNGIVAGIVKRSSVASADADLLITTAPGIFKGYFPGYSQQAFSDTKHWSWIVLKAHSNNTAGTVTLLSSDPRDTPNIHFRSFQDGGAEDIQAVYEGMQLARQIFGNLTSLDNTWSETIPGTSVQTEEELKDYIVQEAWGHHACCTAKIGADSDAMAVLDSKFRVKGTTGLRVVDASVFPKIPGYFIVTAIYMISEKAADVIIADAQASPVTSTT
ncbi:hypothetical protein V8C42DRAFT_362198 [Trichoderma barbatum]